MTIHRTRNWMDHKGVHALKVKMMPDGFEVDLKSGRDRMREWERKQEKESIIMVDSDGNTQPDICEYLCGSRILMFFSQEHLTSYLHVSHARSTVGH